jgi:release factor glutamine methyltransferase
MTTLDAALAKARAAFADAVLVDAAIEARILIGGLLGLSATQVFTGGDRVIGAEDLARIEDAVARRLKREPVHRILGRREFYGLDLSLSEGTLEPRPDTEVLVEAMLEPAKRIAANKGRLRILDLGTGTGAIVLALLTEIPEAIGVGCDISEDALATAGRNAAELGLGSRFEPVLSRWFDKISGRFDIIVSNPPYIRSDVIPELEPEVRDFDPLLALDGGQDGFEAYRAIAERADGFLEEGGYLGLEIGFDQREAVTAIFQAAGFILTQVRRDYGDNDRVLVFDRPRL